MQRVAILITNYNMPERCDALCEYIKRHVSWPHDLIVVDNGSDLIEPSKFTTLRLEKNKQTTGGWLAGLRYADDLAATRGRPYFAYWFLITSAEFPANDAPPSDPLTTLIEPLLDNPNAVGVHPALTSNSTTAWTHLITRGGDKPRRTWMIDNIASLYRADWFDQIGRFDKRLVFGWGIDFETCYRARMAGRSLWVHEGVKIEKTTDIGYTMGRMGMTAQDRKTKAGINMQVVLSEKYGPAWNNLMRHEGVTDDMV